MSAPNIPREKVFYRALSVCLFLVLITAAVYAPVRHFDFLTFDDDDYVTENPHVRSGLHFENVQWAFTHSYSNHWHPLTAISQMLDCQLWGMSSGAHHLVNVLYHAANAALLFGVLRSLTGTLWRSALVAALFAWHPLHVESVAWIASRKDLLSALFWFLTMGAYLRFIRRRDGQSYLLIVGCFALGLMSKAVLVTLPCVLLLLDYWPLARWHTTSWRTLLLEKMPLLLMAAAASAVSFALQQGAGHVASLDSLPMTSRLANAALSYAAYLLDTVFPHELAVFYPLRPSLPGWQVTAAVCLLGSTTVLAGLSHRRRPYLLVGWLWFIGTLVPVIGIVQVGGQAMADRYTYIPLIGVFIAGVWLAADWLENAPQKARAAVAATVLAACLVGTSMQLRHWKDTLSLFTHTLAVTSRNHVAHVVLGTALAKEGRFDEGIRHLREALRIQADHPQAHNNLANVLIKLDRLEEAVPHYRASLAAQPGNAEAHSNLSYALLRQGKTEEALAHCREAIRLEPDYAEAWSNLGDVLLARGEADKAANAYDTALQLDPETAEAHSGLGYLSAVRGQFDAAIAHFRRALELKPPLAQAHCGLAAAALEQGRVEDAITHARDSLQAAALPEAHFFLGRAFAEKGLPEEAIAAYREALRIRPAYPEAHNNLAVLLAGSGKSEEAINEWNEVLRLQPGNLEARLNLGATLLRAGRVAEAVTHYEAAIERGPASMAALRNLGWILASHPEAKHRNPARAMELAARAREVGGDEPETLDLTAAALAAADRFDDAVETARKARDLALARGQSGLAREIEIRIELYQLELPFRIETR